MKVKIFLFLCLVLLWVGCTSNDPGAGLRQTGVKPKVVGVSDFAGLNARTDARATETGTSEITGLTFNEALLGVKELEFKLKDGDDDGDDDGGDNSGPGDEDDDDDGDDSGSGDRHDGDDDGHDGNGEIKFEGAFVVDLIAGTSTPDFGVAEVVPGVYEEIEIELSPLLPDSNTVFISFSFIKTESDTIPGDTIRVELSTKKEIEIKIESEHGFQVDENVLNNLLVQVDLDKLIAGIDLTQATPDADGVIRINDSSNTEILNQILGNFRGSCHGGEDDDHDGDIDDD